MENNRKYWLIAILGFLVIILAGAAVAGSRRSRNSVSSTDNPDRQGESWPQVSEGTKNYLREQDTILSDMLRDMEDLPKTGSAEIDYLNAMTEHHQAAAALAESFLKNGGQNPELKELAARIINTQNQEIGRMKSLIESLERNGKQNTKEEENYLSDYHKMLSVLRGTPEEPAGTADEAFAEAMIAHHQMAETMSRSILHHSAEKQVEALADTIRRAQSEENSRLKKIQKNLTSF